MDDNSLKSPNIKGSIEFDDGEVEEVKEESAEEVDSSPAPIASIISSSNISTKKAKKKNRIVLAIIGVVVIAVCGAGGYYLWSTVGKEESDASVSEGGDESSEVKSTPLEYSLSGNDLESFDLSFLKLNDNGNKNIVYSPIGIKHELKALAEKTDQKTQEQIKELLGDYKFKNYQSNNLNFRLLELDWEKYAIKCLKGTSLPCGSIYKNYSGILGGDDPYIRPREYYDNVSFNNRLVGAFEMTMVADRYDYIKAVGGEKKLHDEIKELYDTWLEYDSSVYEYLKGGGNKIEKNAETFVQKAISSLKNDYNKIAQSSDYIYKCLDDYILFSKDLKEYEGTKLQYLTIMPRNESLSAFIKEINVKELNDLIKKANELDINDFPNNKIKKVIFEHPVFEFNYNLNLTQDLRKIGFSNISDELVYGTSVTFSNDGIKKSKLVKQDGNEDDVPRFWDSEQYFWSDLYKYDDYMDDYGLYQGNIDNPFMYLIRDKETGEVWQIGAVYFPTSFYQ